jgi:hypothetical protein
MQYIDIVNTVLRKLREVPVPSVSFGDYSSLIGDFVNEIKSEIESAHTWTLYRDDISFSTTASVESYPLIGFTQNSRIISVWNDTNKVFLTSTSIPIARMHNSAGTIGCPTEYYFKGVDSDNVTPLFYLTAIPDSAYNIIIDSYITPPDLSEDEDEYLLYYMPLVLGTYWKAVEEKGEDGGVTANNAYSVYQKSLSDYILADTIKAQEEFNWYVS